MKKSLSLILAILIFVSSCPAIVLAEETLVHDEVYENALKLVSGVNTGFSLDVPSDKIISRGDFIRLALGLYGMEFTEKETSFTDVSEDLAPYITYAVKMGMIESGVRFYPENPVNYEMASRIAVIMTGYTPLTLSSSFISAVNTAGINKNLDGTEMTFRNAVVLLANILETPMMSQTMYGDDKSRFEIGTKTFLETYHNIVSYEGIVTANEYTSLTSIKDAMSPGYIRIGTEEFRSDDSSLLGYNVRAYYNKDTRKIHALCKIENNEFSCTEIASHDNNTIKYYDESKKEKTIRLDTAYQFIYNGKAYMHAGFENYFNLTDGTATFIDNNNDRTYDVVFVWDYEYMHVKYVDLFNWRIFDINNDAYIDLSADNCKYEVIYQYKNAEEKVELTDIAEGAIITYCLSNDGKYCRIYVSEQNVTGQITEVNKDEKIIKIGDTFYKYNRYFEDYYMNSLGKAATFNIAYDGTILSVSGLTDTTTKYAWFNDAAYIESGLSKSLLVQIYTQDGEMLTLNAGEKITVDGKKEKAKDAYTKYLEPFKSSGASDRVIKYALDSEGLISVIDTPIIAQTIEDKYSAKSDGDTLVKYYEDEYFQRFGFETRFRASTSTVTFYVPADPADRKDSKNFSVRIGSSHFSDGNDYTLAAYDLSEMGDAACLVSVTGGGSNSDDYKRASSAIIMKIRTVYFPELGEIKKVYDVYRSGTFVSCTAFSEAIETSLAAVKPGDIIRYNANSRNEITAFGKDYDFATETFINDDNSYFDYFKGYLDGYDGTNMNVITNENANSLSDVALEEYAHINVARGSQCYVTVTKNAQGTVTDVQVNNIDKNSLLMFRDLGKGADKVIVRRRVEEPIMAAIYKVVVK